MALVTLVLDMPPSANRYWRHWRNRMVKSVEARRYQDYVRAEAQARQVFSQEDWPLKCDVSVEISAVPSNRARNLDNCIKIILDALNGIAYDDDRQVRHIEAFKMERGPKGEAYIAISISPLKENPRCRWIVANTPKTGKQSVSISG